MARYDLSPSGFDVAGARIGIVAARFNDDVVSRLLEAALDTLARHGLDRDGVPVARVPGAFELPLAARWLATCCGPLTNARDHGRSREERRTDRGTTIPENARAGGDGMTADAVIALGAVIRGDTPHFDYVCAEAARGIRAVSLELDVPVIFGVLTCDNHAQALERAGGGPAPAAPPTRGDSADLSEFDPSNPDFSESAGRSRPSADAGDGHRNKGREAALAALEMVSLRRRLGV